MRLVNESDARAYSVHPSWSGMSYDDSCAGDNLKQYRENQFRLAFLPLLRLCGHYRCLAFDFCPASWLSTHFCLPDSEVEGALQNNLTAMWNVVAAAVIVYQVPWPPCLASVPSLPRGEW